MSGGVLLLLNESLLVVGNMYWDLELKMGVTMSAGSPFNGEGNSDLTIVSQHLKEKNRDIIKHRKYYG